MARVYPSPNEPSETEPEPQDATLISQTPLMKDQSEMADEAAGSTTVFSQQDSYSTSSEEAAPVEQSPSMDEVSATSEEIYPAPSAGEPPSGTMAESLLPASETAYSIPAESQREDQTVVSSISGDLPDSAGDLNETKVVSGWSPHPELSPLPGDERTTGAPYTSEPAGQPAQAWEGSPGAVPPPSEPAGTRAYLPPQPAALSPADERTWATLAHLSVLLNTFTGFLGLIAALIIYFMYKDRSRYVAYHAYQSFIFQLIWWVGAGSLAGIAVTISGILVAVVIGCLLLPFALLIFLLPVAALVYGVIGAIEVSQGKDFKYWLIGDWTRSTLTG